MSGLPPIDKDVYEQIWNHYREGKGYQEIADLCKVARGTVQKYITVGDPKRGWEPLKTRLEKLTKRMQAGLFSEHAKKKTKYYQLADEAFECTLEAAHASAARVRDFAFETVDKGDGSPTVRRRRALTDDDDKHYATMVRVAKDLAELMTMWHGTLRALYVGEESEQMLKDLERFTELGDVTPSLREKVKEIVAKEEGATDK